MVCGAVASWWVHSTLDKQSLFKAWLGILCCVILDNALYFHTASLHPGVLIGKSDLNAGGNPAIV